ncbi:hypothetical protein ACE1CA_06065 [Aerosakkonemataceae cyanobacterium BLCC-F167]|uniref:Uncharacterized protein n=1 Tax=Floridaenema evergladense BLCC-F167 TaxID=3153639 RepID=A0ABV4WG80_9CYAN
MGNISVAIVNISAHQRILSQKTALFALKLVTNQNQKQRQECQAILQLSVDLLNDLKPN